MAISSGGGDMAVAVGGIEYNNIKEIRRSAEETKNLKTSVTFRTLWDLSILKFQEWKSLCLIYDLGTETRQKTIYVSETPSHEALGGRSYVLF